MSEQKITIQIDENGQISAKTNGFKGEVCMRALQEILGKKELFADVKPTDDFYAKETSINNTQQRSGLR